MSCCEEDHECEECCLCTDNESEARCDCCEKFTPWEDLATGDDGESWICPDCQPTEGKP